MFTDLKKSVNTANVLFCNKIGVQKSEMFTRLQIKTYISKLFKNDLNTIWYIICKHVNNYIFITVTYYTVNIYRCLQICLQIQMFTDNL